MIKKGNYSGPGPEDFSQTKSITFNKDAQDAISDDVKEKMKQDREISGKFDFTMFKHIVRANMMFCVGPQNVDENWFHEIYIFCKQDMREKNPKYVLSLSGMQLVRDWISEFFIDATLHENGHELKSKSFDKDGNFKCGVCGKKKESRFESSVKAPFFNGLICDKCVNDSIDEENE